MSHWLSKSLAIARMESLRQFRQLREQPTVAALNVVPLLVIVPAVVGEVPVPVVGSLTSTPGAYVYGTRLAAGETAAVLEVVRAASVVVFGMGVYLVALPEFSNDGPDVNVDGLLVSVSPRAIAVGKMLTYFGFVTRLGGVVVLAGVLAFGAGSGSPVATLALLVAGLVALLTTIFLTYPAVLAVKLAFVRVEALRENRLLVGAPLAVLLFAVLGFLRNPVGVSRHVPLAWYADLGLLGSAPGASPLHAAVALASLPVALVVGAVGGGRLGEAVWLADDVRQDDDRSLDRERSTAEAVLDWVAPRQVAAVARVTWWRLRREPQVLLFGGLLVVLTGSAGITAAERFPNAVPYIVAVYGAATVGVGVTLNPLGNEGPMLPGTLTAPDGGRHLVAGQALSASLPGSVLVGTATLATGFRTSLSLPVVLGFAALGALLGAAGPVISLGLGTAFPNFEGVDVVGSTNMQPPHLRAVFVYLLALVGLGFPATLAVSPDVVAGATGLPGSVVAAGGLGATALATVAVAWLSFTYATRRIQGYELDA